VFIFILNVNVFAQPATNGDRSPQYQTFEMLGLIKGYPNDSSTYENKILSRAEAAMIIVRLLGAEQELKDKEYLHPFDDVPNWADKAIGYLYEKGIVKGTSGNKFSSEKIISENDFDVMVLRMLGYVDGVDYLYQDFKSKVYLFRGSLVLEKFDTLFMHYKDSEQTILGRLIQNKKVDASIASGLRLVFDDSSDYFKTEVTVYKTFDDRYGNEYVLSVDTNTLPEELNKVYKIITIGDYYRDIYLDVQDIESAISTKKVIDILNETQPYINHQTKINLSDRYSTILLFDEGNQLIGFSKLYGLGGSQGIEGTSKSFMLSFQPH